MKLLEYEAKRIIAHYGLPVPSASLLRSFEDTITLPAVLKSQVPTGGRGKAGGIVTVTTSDQAKHAARTIFALPINGYTPKTILAEELIAIKREHYVALLIDKTSATIRLVAHKNGGIDVEENTSEDFFNEPIAPGTITQISKKLAEYLTFDSDAIASFVTTMYTAFTQSDATLLEINPLIVTKNNDLTCGDCKMELDDPAAFRHADWKFETPQTNTNFVTINQNGNVATIANGAGLAMATVDAVIAKQLKPANFLDIGGGANTSAILAAFSTITQYPNVQAIIINIFAGITRCDEVARAIIAAKQQINTLPPLYIRLAGTNHQEAVTLLNHEQITTLPSLNDCLDAAKEQIHG